MQFMSISLYDQFATKFDVKFKTEKSMTTRTGPMCRLNSFSSCYNVGSWAISEIFWSLSNKTFICTFSHVKAKYYGTFNNIMQVANHLTQNLVYFTLHIMRACCLPVLLRKECCRVFTSHRERHSYRLRLNNCINTAVAKVFGVAYNSIFV